MIRRTISIDSFLKSLILLYLVSIAFTSAFAFSTFISIPTILAVTISIFFLFLVLRRILIISMGGRNLLLVFWIILTFSFFLFSTGDKCFRHLMMWTISLFSLFFVIKKILVIYRHDYLFLKRVFNTISFVVFLASLFAVLEFILVNLTGTDINLFIPRGAVSEYTPLALNFTRARSFMEESGHFSFFIESLAPISIAWITSYCKNNVFRIVYVLTVLSALFFSFSAFGFIALAIAVTILFYFYFSYARTFRKFIVKVLLVSLLASIVVVISYSLIEMMINLVTIKLDGSVSATDRSNRIDGLEEYLNGINLFIGYGPAAHETINTESYISLYVGILMSTGIIGIALFFMFLIKEYMNILKINDIKFRCAFIISFIVSTMHLSFIDLYYLPWFWIMLSLATITRLTFKNSSSKKNMILFKV